MALLDSSDIMEMVTALGNEDATFDGGVFPVIFHLDRQEQLESGEVVRIGPYVMAEAAQVTSLGIAAGNSGDTITLRGVDYTVLAIDPDGSGLVVLSLEVE